MNKLFKKDESGVFLLPVYDAKKLQAGNDVTLLFEIPVPKINGYNSLFRFDYDTDVHFPAILSCAKDRNTIFPEVVIEKKEICDGRKTDYTLNACVFWCFLGDATHCSEFVSTPYFLIKGQEIIVENRYNVPKMNCIVTDIQMVRDNELRWFWSISLRKLSKT